MRPSVLFALLATAALSAPALAKLPPPDEAATAKAAQTAQKAAWDNKVNAYKVCQIEDHLATDYHGRVTDAPPPLPTPSCAEPGPTPVAAKPIEESGAHSPPGNATSPPSTNATSAELSNGVKK